MDEFACASFSRQVQIIAVTKCIVSFDDGNYTVCKVDIHICKSIVSICKHFNSYNPIDNLHILYPSIFFLLKQCNLFFFFPFFYMLHSKPLEQTTISPWAFFLLKMSKATKQSATIVDKYRFCFTHLNLRFPLTLRRVLALFLFSETLALNSGAHCQMGKRLHRQKERPESIRKWQLFSCARGAGQLPGLVAKVTGNSASWCSGQQLGLMGGWRRMTVGILYTRSGWRCWWERESFKCKQVVL